MSRSDMNRQIYEEAGEWFIDFREGDVDAAGRARFDAWMRRSPEHLRAYLEIAAIWNEGPDLDAGQRFAPEELRTHALLETNLVALPAARDAAPTRRRFARPAAVAIAASLLAAIGATLWVSRTLTAIDRYETGVGEQRSLTLADGSQVELNALSRLTVRLASGERHVELQQGQALFRVAHDPTRPFVVYGDTARVQAVGTEFDVKRRGDGAVITVVTGQVSVGIGVPVLLSAGEQVRVEERIASPPVQVNVAAATAWTQGRLVFEAAPLADVVEEFNRYNRRKLVVGDVGIRTISGAFSSTDPGSLVNFLRQRPGVVVTETQDEIRVFASP